MASVSYGTIPPSDRVWIVGSSNGDGRLSVSVTPKQHESYDSAEKEARRLANVAAHSNTTTIKYMVLELVSVVKVSEQKKGF
jgi:hypothetical protein